MGLKETLKNIPLLRSFVRGCKGLPADLAAIPGFLAERRLSRTGKIRVGFLCQYIPVWHKLEPIYRMMQEDARFEPVLICVPSQIENSVYTGDGENDTLEYFRSHGYEALDALLPDGGWLDLAALNLAYIFYPRPYNSFMPPCYHAKAVSRYSRICLIFYGMNITLDMVETTLNRPFYRYVYCFFGELPFVCKKNAAFGWLCHGLKLQKSVCYGIPGIEAVLESKGAHSRSWDFSKAGFRVMWTPRWTTDKSLGGSNFFTYYRALFAYAQSHPEMDFLFRPHPLALKHFQQTGEMTQWEAEEFLRLCAQIPNISLDGEKEYTATLWQTDVLVSDMSGLVPEYIATGKPLIFCATNFILTPEPTMARMLEGSYIVHSREELFHCLESLQKGIDPLAEKRAQIHAEVFNEQLCCPSRRILEDLAGERKNV